MGKSNLVVTKNPVAKDSNKGNMEDKSRSDREEIGRSDLIVTKNRTAEDLVAENSGRIEAKDKGRQDIKEVIRPNIVIKDIVVEDLVAEDLVAVVEQKLARQIVITFSYLSF